MLRMRFAVGALALAMMGCALSPAWATSTTVSGSRTSSLNMSGSDTLSITSTGVFTTSGTAVTVNGASTSALTITNLGTLKSTSNRAIRINDSTTTNAHWLTVVNGSSTNATALIESDGDDAIQSSNVLNGGTIEIDNYGTIYSKANRAINLTAATGGTVIINNYATGLIEAVGSKDVIRPASGSTISNYGQIVSTDESDQADRNDAIDFQSNATDTVYGTVYNYTGGVIKGAKHGITGNIGTSQGYYIYNGSDASITGLNGSGINLDIPDDIAAITDDTQKRAAVAALKTATVVNYGTITGEAHDATGTDTDGDGIDIDSVVDIENYGTVQALGAIGYKDGVLTDPNISDGLAIGGGTVNNYVGGVITSVGRGIQVDDSEAGAAFAATNIYNAGTIEGDVLAINIVGDWADTLTNKGTITGDVYMGGGDDTVSLYTGATMDGALDGGDGTGDTLKLESDTGGSAAGSLSDVANFENLAVNGGTWSLTDDQSYSGGTTVADDATLKANATLTSAVTVDAGGTLGGTGTVSSIDAYGTVAPGNSIGTLSTTGDVTFESGSTFAVEVSDTPAADFLSVGGTAELSGGAVDVTALTGTWAWYNKVAILTADGGVLSEFSAVTDDAAFLNSSLEYEGNTVYLILSRNDVAFTDITATQNQYNVAAAVDQGGSSSGLYSHLIADTESQARSDLDSLSGEAYASNAGTLADQATLVADTILSRFGDPVGDHHGAVAVPAYGDDTRPGANAASNALADAPVYAAWAKGFGQSLAANGDGNAAGLSGGVGGGLLGMDVSNAGVRAGIAAGYASASSDVVDRASTSSFGTGILAAYAGTETGPVRLRGGASYGWSSVDTQRTATVGSLTEHPTASYDAGIGNVFLEAAHPYPLAGLDLEPFAGLAYTVVSQGAFTEQNAPVTGLSSDAQSFTSLYSTLGLRLASSVVAGDVTWRNHAMLGWRHAYGDLTPESVMTFEETGASFLVAGTPIASDSAVVEAGVDVAAGPAATVGVAYSGALSGNASSHAVRVSGALTF